MYWFRLDLQIEKTLLKKNLCRIVQKSSFQCIIWPQFCKV